MYGVEATWNEGDIRWSVESLGFGPWGNAVSALGVINATKVKDSPGFLGTATPTIRIRVEVCEEYSDDYIGIFGVSPKMTYYYNVTGS